MIKFINRLFHKRINRFSYWIKNFEYGLWCDLSTCVDVKFSIIIPTYNTPVKWLDLAIKSVIKQSYENWELIIVDDGSSSPALIRYLKKLRNKKIKVIYNDINSHISSASNDGLEEATGDYVTFLDHDDYLAPQALNEIICVLSENDKIKLVYSDEDLVSEKKVRKVPHFKSDFNLDLLRSHNYITHLCCYSRKLLDDLGGFRIGFEGAQDYDLVLRAVERLECDEIAHVPKILYHWRMVEGSTSCDASSKNYATEAGLKALKDHIFRLGLESEVEHDERQNFYRIRWPLPETGKVSVIIPTRDGFEILESCLKSFSKTVDYPDLEIILIDNGSECSKTLEFLNEIADSGLSYFNISDTEVPVHVVRDDGDFNFSRLINLGVSNASGDFLLLLNNDIEAISDGWFEELLSQCSRSDIGCVGAKLLYPDETIQHAGVILGLGGYAAHSHRGINRNDAGYFYRAQTVQNLSAVTGACLMIKKSIFHKVNGFDERFKVAYNDVDFCLRVSQLGLRNLYTPFAELFHHESKTRGSDSESSDKIRRFDAEKQLFLSLWSDKINHDPYYNPNLTRSSEDFSIRN
jgi:GT2 family glycosyltransferase